MSDAVLAIVKTRLRIPEDNHDDLINSYITEIGNRIKHYCNISEVPATFEGTWASMVIDALKVEQSTVEAIADNIDSGESIKIGDTSVAPAKSEGITSTSKKAIDEVVLNYRVDLNRYRKLRW